jgi:hypothetical protein
LGRRLGCKRTVCTLQYNNHGYLTLNQFGDECRQLIVPTLCPPVFDRNALVLDVPSLSKATAKSSKVLAVRFRRCEVEKPDHRYGWLLRARRKRPGNGSAAEKRDEVASPHSTTSQVEGNNLSHGQRFCAAQQSVAANVRFGSKADIAASPSHDCFTPKSGHGSAQLQVKR